MYRGASGHASMAGRFLFREENDKVKSERTIHVLLRFSDHLLRAKNTIDEHNKVVQAYGAVWFGKMGSPISQVYTDCINHQIESGVQTFAYLVKGNRRKSTAYRAAIVTASRLLPETEKQMIPSYYFDQNLTRYMKFWVKLAEISEITFDELAKMRVASSVLPISETLVKSSTGHFFLVENTFSY